jgi:3-oxoacyl-[acyl-carrier protein] reductase
MDLGIEGRVALVMGASRGLGHGIAAALARERARVAIASRSGERIEGAAASLRDQTGGEVHAFTADTSDLDALRRLVAEVGDSLGPIEILVTNTGGPPPGDPLELGREDWEAAYRSLVLAPMELIKAVVPAMRERGWGRIVNVTSVSTKEPIEGLVLSNSHRLAVVGAFKTLARQLPREGIVLNSVAPGRIATDRIAELSGTPLEELRDAPQPDIPVGRLGTTEEFGDAVVFLCSERASYVCGVNLLVDGGLSRGI